LTTSSPQRYSYAEKGRNSLILRPFLQLSIPDFCGSVAAFDVTPGKILASRQET
jgi:hypothetical protein